MNLAEILEKAIQYDLVGRRIEALKLYESGIAQLLQKVKGKFNHILVKKIYAEHPKAVSS